MNRRGEAIFPFVPHARAAPMRHGDGGILRLGFRASSPESCTAPRYIPSMLTPRDNQFGGVGEPRQLVRALAERRRRKRAADAGRRRRHVRPYFVSDGSRGTGTTVIRHGAPEGTVSGDLRGQVRLRRMSRPPVNIERWVTVQP